MVALLDVDAVEHEIEIRLVALDLRVLQLASGIVDRERMEPEDVAQQAHLVVGGLREVRPEGHGGFRVEPPGLDPRLGPRVAVLLDVDRYHGRCVVSRLP